MTTTAPLAALLVLLGALAVSAETRTGKPMISTAPIIDLARMTCSANKMTDFLNPEGQVIVDKVCKKQYENCLLEGSCVIKKIDGTRETLSYHSWSVPLQRRLFSVTTNKCRYGQGFGKNAEGKNRQTCLDPYFSVAADGRVHRLGEVIFVPKLEGIELPTGEIHDGYLIVRDTGRALDDRGQDAFSFFSGLEGDRDTSNPFVQHMLDNIDYGFDYEMIDGEKAEQVRKARNYPKLIERLAREYYK